MSDEDRQRTKLQNSCLHKWCDDVAMAMDSAGLDMRKVLKPEVEIPWTKESVKKYIFNTIAEVMFDVDSSADLTTAQMQQVTETIVRHMAVSQPKLVLPPWPTKYNGGGRE